MKPWTFLLATILLLVVSGVIFVRFRSGPSTPLGISIAMNVNTPPKAPGVLTNVVSYSCDNAKNIMAGYFEGPTPPAPAPGEPPTPTGSLALTFDGGKMMTLKQTISADGARYANSDESFVFWSKGSGAMVLQNGQEKDFTNCVVAHAMATTTPPVVPGIK